jgi:hypothetical protein
LLQFSNERLKYFYTHVNSTICPSIVSPSPHCYTSPQTKAFSQFYGPSSRSHVALLQGLSFVPMPWTFVPYSKDPCPYSHLAHLSLHQEPLYKRMPWTFASYSKDPRPYLHLTHLSLLQGPLFVPAPLHHTAHHHQLLYHLLRRLIPFEESFSNPISMLRHHSTQKLKPMALSPTLLY